MAVWGTFPKEAHLSRDRRKLGGRLCYVLPNTVRPRGAQEGITSMTVQAEHSDPNSEES